MQLRLIKLLQDIKLVRVFIVFWVFTSSATSQHIQEKLTSFPIYTLAGTDYLFDKIEHEIILVNFWASWCLYCKAEFESMFKLANDMNGRLSILAISVDENRSNAMDYLRVINFQSHQNPHVYFAIDLNKSLYQNVFKLSSIPTTLIIQTDRISKHKRLIKEIKGAKNWQRTDIEKYLN